MNYIFNSRTKCYHHESCYYSGIIDLENRVVLHDVPKRGNPCSFCRPPVRKEEVESL